MASKENMDFLSADTIEGDKVVNASGDDLGKFEDLMIDLDNGRVAFAVLSFGGFLGMAEKLFAIPWQALSLRLHEHAFELDIPKDVLEKAEGFDKDNWPVTREELSRTYTYYGYQPYWQTEVSGRTMQAGASTGAQGMIESQGPAGPGSRDNPDFLSADSIKSDKVVNRDGDKVGKIEELMIDLQDGRIAYTVLSHGGFLGIGNKLFAIPWQALTLRVHEHEFLLDIPKETLDKAEGLDKDNWPLTRDELARTYTYYGYQPYWQTGAMTEAAVAAATGTSVMVGETESESRSLTEREILNEMPMETEPGKISRAETERQTAVPMEIGPQGVSRMETERKTAIPTEAKPERMSRTEMERHGRLETAEELIAGQEKERIEELEKKETDPEKLAQLEKEKEIAERREHKYGK